MFEVICNRLSYCNREALEPVMELAVEIAREGREGRRIGTSAASWRLRSCLNSGS